MATEKKSYKIPVSTYRRLLRYLEGRGKGSQVEVIKKAVAALAKKPTCLEGLRRTSKSDPSQPETRAISNLFDSETVATIAKLSDRFDVYASQVLNTALTAELGKMAMPTADEELLSILDTPFRIAGWNPQRGIGGETLRMIHKGEYVFFDHTALIAAIASSPKSHPSPISPSAATLLRNSAVGGDRIWTTSLEIAKVESILSNLQADKTQRISAHLRVLVSSVEVITSTISDGAFAFDSSGAIESESITVQAAISAFGSQVAGKAIVTLSADFDKYQEVSNRGKRVEPSSDAGAPLQPVQKRGKKERTHVIIYKPRDAKI